MIPAGLPAPQFPLNPNDPAVNAYVRESARMWRLRGMLDRDEAIGTTHGEVYEWESELDSERCESLCIILENLALTREWPPAHVCDEPDVDSSECPGCVYERRRIEAVRAAHVQPPPDDGTTDIAF